MKQGIEDFLLGMEVVCGCAALAGGGFGMFACFRYGFGALQADLPVQVMAPNLLLWCSSRLVSGGAVRTTAAVAARAGVGVAVFANCVLAAYDLNQKVVHVTAPNCGFDIPLQKQGVIQRGGGVKVHCLEVPSQGAEPGTDDAPSRSPRMTAGMMREGSTSLG